MAITIGIEALDKINDSRLLRNIPHMISIIRYAETLITEEAALINKFSKACLAAGLAYLMLQEHNLSIIYHAKALAYCKRGSNEEQTADSIGEIIKNIFERFDWTNHFGQNAGKIRISHDLNGSKLTVTVKAENDLCKTFTWDCHK